VKLLKWLERNQLPKKSAIALTSHISEICQTH